MVFLHVLEWNRFLAHLAESEVTSTVGLVQEKGIGRDEPLAGAGRVTEKRGKGEGKVGGDTTVDRAYLPKSRTCVQLHVLILSLFQSQSLFPMRGAS